MASNDTRWLDGSLPMTDDARNSLRKALAVGLHCYSEIVRIREALDLQETLGQPLVATDVTPIHPTGDVTVPGVFADAMMWLECTEG